jgi:putative addiction module killer protein
MRMFEIRRYLTPEGRDVFTAWLDVMKDRIARVAIVRRIESVELGNFGDHRFCRDGVWELRIDVGPGYRVYYARSDQTVVILLCGGDKRTQDSDIAKACSFWQDWQRRTAEQEKGR